jgi:1,4-dihydroxy-2-naphthoate octaprenyltransferase
VIAWQAEVFDLLAFVLALLGVLALQIAANLFNEYFDHIKGVEAGKSHGLGLILKSGALTPRQILLAAVFSLAIGCAIGVYFVAQAGWVILAIGIAAVIVVVLYTATPYALAYIGLGEVAVFIFMGPLIVIGTYYVMAQAVTSATLWGALPIGFLVAAILHANNLRDLEADRLGGKQTLAVRFGRRTAQLEYAVWVLGAYTIAVILMALGQIPWTALLAFVTLPEALRLTRLAMTSEDVPILHGVLVHTARLHALFGLSYVVGWLAQQWL